MSAFIKYMLLFISTLAIHPYFIVVKYFDASNHNTLLSNVVFTYKRETQRDSAFTDLIAYYNEVDLNLGGYAFIDTTQNALIIIDRQ